MVERVERRFDLRPERLVGDTVYGVARLLKWLVDRKITPHVPVWDKSARHDGTFRRADFVFDQERNVYICPGGAELTSTGNIDQGHIVYYRANKDDCSACSLKPRCTRAAMRKVTRDINEEVRDRVRALANTEAFRQSRRERKKVEMRFAHMKPYLPSHDVHFKWNLDPNAPNAKEVDDPEGVDWGTFTGGKASLKLSSSQSRDDQLAIAS